MPQPTRADTSQAARANVSVDAPRTDAPAGAQVVARLDTASGARAPTAADLRAEHERQEKPAFEQAAAQLRQAVRHDPALAALSRQLAIDITPEGLRIQLLDEDWTAMFVTGSATPNDRVRLLLLYGRENNGWIVHLINPLRRALFSRMSLRLVHALSSPLTAPLWCALRVGLPHGAYYRLIRRFSLEHLRAIVFDHMIPRMALCYTRAEAEALPERVGLTDVRSIWVNEDAWSAIGRRAGG